MKKIAFILFISIRSLTIIHAQESQRVYLSGTGSDHTTPWQFFCTGGMNASKWTTIQVPSCWEQQGFGKYDYGFAKDSVRGKEQGFYKVTFDAPAHWKDKLIDIVFEGVMTDAEVKINGKLAGPIHQGAFYSFRYDITSLLKYGKSNLLEVKVSKHSANESVNAAERKGDYWIFGGIFRPVFLDVHPKAHINSISIDAKANGYLRALISSTKNAEVKFSIKDFQGKEMKRTDIEIALNNNGITDIHTSFADIKPWSTENPVLYEAIFDLYENNQLVHQVKKKIGFRTVEVKQRDGIYVNGVKVKLKGVNRHSFHPVSGRSTNKNISIEDVLLMKDMNMNAVRMSHYPPDEHFLDVCDSLGLFVMDELAGWHGNYTTETGTKLLKEMIEHDVNHPSIIMWSNGNEGGHNLDLDTLFNQYDIQHRVVVHPWAVFNGFDTQHYREFNYGIGNYDHGHDIVMPTEFLHGWFDGGHGAGLEDYWEKMWNEPLQAGGFLWDFIDQAIMRKDLNDSLDTDKYRGADGIMGPFHQKEGSYFTIKEVWSPVKFEKREMTKDFDGELYLENRYHYTNLQSCSFSWSLKRFEWSSKKQLEGNATSPNIAPGQKGVLKLELPENWHDFDVLYVTSKDMFGRELFTWSFPIVLPSETASRIVTKNETGEVNVSDMDSIWQIGVKDIRFKIQKSNGRISSLSNKDGNISLSNGPVLEEGLNNFSPCELIQTKDSVEIRSTFNRKSSYNTLKWTIYPSGWVKLDVSYFPSAYFTNFSGINFSLTESDVKSVTYMGNGPYRVWKNRMKGNRFDVWTKDYNNTETGESPWKYPEFKGYHSNFYGGVFHLKNNQFTVATDDEDVFLRLFTPAWKTDQWHNYETLFPSGDLSFMKGIPSIGSKSVRNENTGPMGFKNIYYDYEKDPSRAIHMTLYFNFSQSK